MAGIEWLLEAYGCPEAILGSREKLAELFQAILLEMKLKPVSSPVWHQFPEPGGITGFWLLKESHLAIHTFPEYQSACLNVFCCSERQSLNWKVTLAKFLGAKDIQIREYLRVYHK